MIRQVICVEKYWKVIVYYNVNYNFFDIIEKDFKRIHTPLYIIKEIHDELYYGKAKACTYSLLDKHVSIVLLNPHDYKVDYINSIIHEAEHVKQAMLEAYNVKDTGEPPAYTIGYLVERMYRVFKSLL